MITLGSADPRAVTAPTCATRALALPGADLYAVAGVAKRIVSIRLFWNGGPSTEALASAGLHAAIMPALLRAVVGPSGQTLAEQLESMGIVTSAGVGDTWCHLELRGPRESARRAFRFLIGSLDGEAIGEREFLGGRALALHDVDRRGHDIRAVALDALRSACFDAASRLSLPPEGTRDGLESVTLDNVRSAARKLISGQRLQVLITGDDDLAEYAAELRRVSWASWGAVRQALPEVIPALAPPARALAVTELREQAHLLWGALVPIDGPRDYITLELATHILGGWSGSRWHALFRDELGYTYGTYSAAQPIGHEGSMWCLAQVGLSVSADALAHTRELITEQTPVFTNSLTADEVGMAAVQLLRAEAVAQDSARGLMSRAAAFLQGGLAPAFAEQRIAALRGLTLDEMRERLKSQLHQPTLVISASAKTLINDGRPRTDDSGAAAIPGKDSVA